MLELSGIVYKALFDALKQKLTYNGKKVPIFVEIASKTVLPCWVLISQFTQADGGSKMGFGYRCSVLVEVVLRGDDFSGLCYVTSSLLELLYPVKNAALLVDDHVNIVMGEPTINQIIEQYNDDLYLRKLIRIEMLIY